MDVSMKERPSLLSLPSRGRSVAVPPTTNDVWERDQFISERETAINTAGFSPLGLRANDVDVL